jgi:general secretion pathway protein L
MAERNYADMARKSFAELGRRTGLAGFGAWWLHELSGIAPTRLRSALERRRLRPVVSVDGDRVSFWRPMLQDHGYRMQEVASIALGSDLNAAATEGRAAMAALIPEGAHPAVTLVLPVKQILRRTLTLPAAVADNLRATVGYDLDRLTPFKPEDVYFDATILARDNARGTLTVDVVAARRRVVDQAVAVVTSFGADVVAVVPATPEQAALSRLDLLPTQERHEGSFWTQWQVLAPLVLLFVLAATAAIVPIWQKRNATIALIGATDAENVRAQESDGLRTELERMTANYNFTLERKLTHPGVGQIIDEVSRLLPDDTWLTQFEYKTTLHGNTETQRDVFIRGESANAGKLVSLLEDAKFVGQATPRSPTTKLQPGPGESFDLSLKVKDLPLPPMLALADAAAAAAVRPPPKAAAAEAKAAPAAPAGPLHPGRPAIAPSADDANDGSSDTNGDMPDDQDAPPPVITAPPAPKPDAPKVLPQAGEPPAKKGPPARGGFGPFPAKKS